ncbi:MAG: hypothetical protein LBV74_02105 [Tannerella sp.]|jgi:hypothetical protein|nr:hypothetical protein [Tannerella sp.]
MGKYISIHTAISYLPDHLITGEIAQAAIDEGHISILKELPAEFLTTDDTIKVIENSSGGKFDLSAVVPEVLTTKVCEKAIECDVENIKHVPAAKVNRHMLKQLLILTSKNIGLLSFIPANIWDSFAVYKGLFSIFGTTISTSYGRSNRSYSHPLPDDQKHELANQLLGLTPPNIKTKDFYMGFFNIERLSAKDATLLIPNEFKDYDYWKLLAKYGFDLIPEDRYSYEIFLIAIDKESKGNYKLFSDEVWKQIYSCIDDRMADAIIDHSPYHFKKLPPNCRTIPRLLKAIERIDNRKSYDFIMDDRDIHLLTDKVCKAFVKKDRGLPKIPNHIWNDDFAAFCLEYNQSFEWFKQMPKELQTEEIVEKAIAHSDRDISYARPELISLEISQRIFRNYLDHSDILQKYVPQRYIDDFINLTGLPQQFFGGEVSLSGLKSNKGDYTFCKVGHCYLGFYKTARYSGSPAFLIMTRRSPHSIKPQQVFDKKIGTYHSTWLEKMIADNDSLFTKPYVDKKLKQLQINPYYELEYIEFYKGIKIYSNTLFMERINYTAEIKGRVIQEETKEELRKTIDSNLS